MRILVLPTPRPGPATGVKRLATDLRAHLPDHRLDGAVSPAVVAGGG